MWKFSLSKYFRGDSTPRKWKTRNNFYNERLDRRTIFTVCSRCTWLVVMALFRYFKHQDGLHDPRRTLSTSILPTATDQATHKIQKQEKETGSLQAVQCARSSSSSSERSSNNSSERSSSTSSGVRATIRATIRASVQATVGACTCGSTHHKKFSWVRLNKEKHFYTEIFYTKISLHENIQKYGNKLMV